MTEPRIAAREFAGQRAKVTVGLIDGETQVGFLDAFDPQAPGLSLDPGAQRASAESPPPTLPAHRLAFVAFHGESSLPAEQDPALRVCEIHVPGSRSFTVLVPTEALGVELGFYGRPKSRYGLYSEIFFYRKGVSAIEDTRSLGSLLVEERYVDSEGVEAGVDRQKAQRNKKIGDLLVETEKVAAEVIEQAVAEQQSQSRWGRTARIGEILVDAGVVTEEDIEEALAAQSKQRGKRLGQVLIDMGLVTEEQVAKVLARKFHIEYINLDETEIDPAALREVPTSVITRFRVLPLAVSGNRLTVALSDPLAFEAIEMLRFSSEREVREVVVTPSQLHRYLEPFLASVAGARTGEIEAILENLEYEGSREISLGLGEIDVEKSEGQVSRLVNRIILDAAQSGASDIHIEPNGVAQDLNVRFRVDGVCELYRHLPADFRRTLVARIKIMANLDVTERRKPQDGKIALRFDRQLIELRVSTIPTLRGDEDAVLRILPPSGAMPIEELDLGERNRSLLERLVQSAYGILLAVGPTGSGKTTTLHALLACVDPVKKKIWTVEDPVEITQPHLRQVQVQPSIEVTFSSILRSFLRADPDVIMVGEMRDLETARIAVQASLTGHLVFSTLHTNTAPETVTRLVDMGVDPFLFSDALLAILGQRLARRLCSACRESYEPDAVELADLEQGFGREAVDRGRGEDGRLVLYRGQGCQRCRGSGYRGRIALHELLVGSPEIREAIQQREPVAAIRELARREGMTSLAEDGFAKALAGLTDPRQVLAVCIA